MAASSTTLMVRCEPRTALVASSLSGGAAGCLHWSEEPRFHGIIEVFS